ncbi:hypothetical protein IC582_012597 [Cucumis melo]
MRVLNLQNRYAELNYIACQKHLKRLIRIIKLVFFIKLCDLKDNQFLTQSDS